ncbi:hypothetical protein DRQ20_06180, partial [bacterium]
MKYGYSYYFDIFHIWEIRMIDGERLEGEIVHNKDGLVIIRVDPYGPNERYIAVPSLMVAFLMHG